MPQELLRVTNGLGDSTWANRGLAPSLSKQVCVDGNFGEAARARRSVSVW